MKTSVTQKLLDIWEPGSTNSSALRRMVNLLIDELHLADLALYSGPVNGQYELEVYQYGLEAPEPPTETSWWGKLWSHSGEVGASSGQARTLPATPWALLDEDEEPVPVAKLTDGEDWRERVLLLEGGEPTLIRPLHVNDERVGLLIARAWDGRMDWAELEHAAGMLTSALVIDKRITEDKQTIKRQRHDAAAERQLVLAALSNDKLIETLLRQCALAVRFDAAAFVTLVDETPEDAKLHYGLENIPALTPAIVPTMLSVESLAGQLFVHPDSTRAARDHAIKSLVALPIYHEHACRGLLTMFAHKRPQPPNLTEMRTLQRYAELLGLVLGKEDEQRRFERSYLQTLELSVEAIELSSPSLRGHHKRIKDLTGQIAAEMKLPAKERAALATAAALHDIGQLQVEGQIEGVLAAMEHPRTGASMVMPLDNGELVGRYIMEHHETYDGFGMPGQLAGDALSMEGQVLALSEWVVERTTTGASVGEDLAVTARKIAQQAGSRFHPEVAKASARVIAAISAEAFAPGDCQRHKGCPDEICQGCAARGSREPCWLVAEAKRQCSLHGDHDCDRCFIKLTWGSKTSRR